MNHGKSEAPGGSSYGRPNEDCEQRPSWLYGEPEPPAVGHHEATPAGSPPLPQPEEAAEPFEPASDDLHATSGEPSYGDGEENPQDPSDDYVDDVAERPASLLRPPMSVRNLRTSKYVGRQSERHGTWLWHLIHAPHLIHLVIMAIGAAGAGTAGVAAYQYYSQPSTHPLPVSQSEPLQFRLQSPDVKELAFQIDSFYATHGRLPRDLQELRMSALGAFGPAMGTQVPHQQRQVDFAATGPGQYVITIHGQGAMDTVSAPMSVPPSNMPTGVPLMRGQWDAGYATRALDAANAARPGPPLPTGYVPTTPDYRPSQPTWPTPPSPLVPSPHTPPSTPMPGGGMPGRPTGPSGPMGPSAPMPGGGGRR